MFRKWYVFAFVLTFVAIVLLQPLLLAQNSLVSELAQVQQYIERGNLTMASYLLNQVEAKAPESFLPYLNAIRGNLALQQGDYNHAIATYERLHQEGFGAKKTNRLALLNNYTQALINREQTYLALADDDLARTEEFIALGKSDRAQAKKLATEAVDLAREESLDSAESVNAQLHLASINGERVNLAALEREISALADSDDKVEFYLDLAQISPQPLPLLQQSLSIAQAVGSARSLSSSWGKLGLYWENQGDSLQALKASHQAALAAQEGSDWLFLANWQWLSARAYQQMGQSEQALAAYRNAVASVKQLRQELAGSPVGQSLYFDTIDPLLRDFLGFLLSRNAPSDELLGEAISVLRLNQLSELDNYFGEICQVAVEVNPSRPSDTLTIFTVLLPQQAYEILQLSDGSHRLVKLSVSGEALKEQAFGWRKQLMNQFYKYYIERSSSLYQIAIAPIEEHLQQVSHLVFVQDGVLRTVPMAALYDGKQFLIERYAISYSLGLGGNLEATQPREPLIAASSTPSQAFPNPIPGVIEEAKQIESVLGGGTQLLNQSFTPKTLATQLENEDYELLHLASHSRFTGLAEEALVQTGAATLSLIEFERLLRSRQAPLGLLALSACDTAAGSRYAVLGLAGIGLRSGIESVLGSLWFASDLDTVNLVTNFYQFWKNGNSLEESLRKAQILQLNRQPSYTPTVWAAFVLLKS